MRKLVIILSALCGLSAPAIGQSARPKVVPLFPGSVDGPAVIIPAASTLRLTPSNPERPNKAAFSGRMTLTGTYEIMGYGDDAWATMWPDSKSLAALPQWQDWWEGPPTEIFFENGWSFAQAVAGTKELNKLKSDMHRVRGSITIIVDRYEIEIECDHASYSARFVAVVKPSVQLAAKAREEEGAC